MEIKVNANIGGVEYLKQDPKWVANLIEKLKVAFCEEMNAWYSYIITEKFERRIIMFREFGRGQRCQGCGCPHHPQEKINPSQ